MKIQTNISEATEGRLRAVLADGETVAGFLAASVEREIARRERGGKVVVPERKPGRPKTPPEQSERSDQLRQLRKDFR